MSSKVALKGCNDYDLTWLITKDSVLRETCRIKSDVSIATDLLKGTSSKL